MGSSKPHAGTSVLEWISASVGLVLLFVVIVVVGHDAIVGSASTPPAISVEARRIVSTKQGFLVEFDAVNSGGTTAAAVDIEGELTGGEASETAHASLDYVAGNGHASGGLFFSHDPRSGSLKLRATGYQEP